MELFIVTSEYPGGSEFLMTVFASRKKAISAYNKQNEEVSPEVYEIQSVLDDKDEKQIFYFDGTYGLTNSFRKIQINKEFSAF